MDNKYYSNLIRKVNKQNAKTIKQAKKDFVHNRIPTGTLSSEEIKHLIENDMEKHSERILAFGCLGVAILLIGLICWLIIYF